MFRIQLLTTTILVVVGSLSFPPAHASGISGQSSNAVVNAAGPEKNRASTFQFSNPVRDRNRDFLCTYGYRVYYNEYAHSSRIIWQHYAVPIKGKGASVTEIIVTDEPYSQTRSRNFNVGIYNSASGHPGSLIVGGSGTAKGSCRLTKVAIPKTFLKAGKKYWVVESAVENAPHRSHRPNTRPVEVFWGYKPKAKGRNALYQYYSAFSVFSSLSDWLPVGGPDPFVNVR